MTAPSRRLARAGVGRDALALLMLYRRALVLTLHPERMRTSLKDWRELNVYLELTMGSEPIERFRILHLDKSNRLIHEDDWSRGTIDEAPVYVREVVYRALELGAAAILIVHNHPTGDLSPSHTDIQLSRSLQEACKAVGITLHDHLIVAATGTSSMRFLSLL